MELVYDYIRNDALRHQLNALTRKTFGFDFEKWVTNGFQTSPPTKCAFCKTAQNATIFR